jgi:serine protease AprX
MVNSKFWRSIGLSLLMVLLCYQAQAQQESRRYLIYFKDKKKSSYSLDKPEKFLTNRAIQRRKNQQIPIQERDIPVSRAYIQELQAQGGKVWYVSRWFNAALVEANAETLLKIKALPFVKSEVVYLTSRKPYSGSKQITFPQNTSENTNIINSDLIISSPDDYGNSFNQTQMIGADIMHKMGFKGKGMIIAVLDAGFENAHKLSFFKHLMDDKRILGTYNFVENHENVYASGSHGLEVLSTIAAYEKGKIIGTAPEASFYLFRTEDANSEYRVEEVNWLVAAERADSLGVDVINSSLGYTNFDDSSMDYSYSMMDGNTALVTRAADMAASTGILVVNSAGNEGGTSWQYVSAPADADSVLAVGAVDRNGNYVSFSSTGPTINRHIKPNVAAQGLMATVGKPSGGIGFNNGTSFSSPIMCGLVTGLWQANPKLSNMEIIQVLQESASISSKPDTLLGYGIPNFKKAHEIAQKKAQSKLKKGESLPHSEPNIPQKDRLNREVLQPENKGK